jgi:hypothetical protein
MGFWRGTGLDLDPSDLQMHIHRVKHQPTQIVLLQHVTEAQYGRFVRRRGHAKIDAHEPAHCRRLLQQFLDAGIGQVEPLLYEVCPEHDRKPHRLPTFARLRIVRTHQRLQCQPWNHLLHLIQKQLTTALPSLLLEPTLRRKTLLLHRSSPHPYEINQSG